MAKAFVFHGVPWPYVQQITSGRLGAIEIWFYQSTPPSISSIEFIDYMELAYLFFEN